MTSLATRLSGGNEKLLSAVETAIFALKHEVRRVYEVESVGLNKPEASDFPRPDLMRACGLLRNCFQQSVLCLAQAFDCSSDAEALCQDQKVRLEQSLLLQRELTQLLQKVYRLEKERGVLQILNFINSLERFRREVMQFLMYKDWEEFEGFVEEISKTYDETRGLDQVLHRFACYLETLQNHVSMRSVLNNKHAWSNEAES
jgi:hypothetical protein